MDKQKLKEICIRTIDEHRQTIINVGKKLYDNPELGYKEVQSTETVYDFLKNLGLEVEKNIAITGCRARVNGDKNGPKIAVLGELDAICCKDHKDANKKGDVHACGHNIQIAAMLGAALALVKSDISSKLDGKIDFIAVPAEEFIELEYRKELKKSGSIEFFGGKQELIYRGVFDDVDISMMVHALDLGKNKIMLDMKSNGFVGKNITFIGKASHAGSCPEEGINALNTAMLALNNINSQRETFRDEDWVRVHAIITKGGDIVNVVPSEVKMEAYVRARYMDSILHINNKVNNGIAGAAMATGAVAQIEDTFGYLPIINDKGLIDVFKDNMIHLGREDEVIEEGKSTASFDFGDLSHIIPSIHPMVGGVEGNLHTAEFKIVDEEVAYILPAKIMALSIIDLLYGGAEKGRYVISNFKAMMTKEEYVRHLKNHSKKYLYKF